jgi:hypothetical protein
MSQPVTINHDGFTVTTNTGSEADLRAALETPGPAPTPAGAATPTPPAGDTASGSGEPVSTAVRDDKGRFVKREAAAPPEAAPALPLTPATEPAKAEAAAEKPARDPALPRHDPIARMKQALAQKAEAERRAQALEAELQRLRQPAVTSPVTPPVYAPPTNGHAPSAEPQFEAFASDPDPYTAYMQAWTRWDHAQQLAQTRAQWEAEQAHKARMSTFEQSLAAGREKHPDFDRALTEADTLGLQISSVMQAAILESPRAADLVYHLATHPEVCLQLAEESIATPVAAAPLMRRLLETSLGPSASPAAPSNGTGTAAKVLQSTAKPPVTPVGSSPVVSDAPPGDEASAAEHARYWNRKLKVPGTR